MKKILSCKNFASYILITGFLLGLASCTSAPKAPSTADRPTRYNEPIPKRTSEKKSSEEIDYKSIQRLLELDVDYKKLGYFEKNFNTCQIGYGYSKLDHCRTEFFIVANFRVMCRDSEGTISTVLTDDDLRPLAQQDLHWFLKNADGTLRTDGYGYGQIILTSTIPQKNQRLRLSNGKDFLLLRARDVRQLIVPKNWCAF